VRCVSGDLVVFPLRAHVVGGSENSVGDEGLRVVDGRMDKVGRSQVESCVVCSSIGTSSSPPLLHLRF
jgi:hypothetical protein